MNIMNEKVIEVNGKKYILKLTMGALYRVQLNLKKAGLIDVMSTLDKLDIVSLYEIVVQSEISRKLKVEDLLKADDLNVLELTEYISNSLGALFTKSDSVKNIEVKKQ